MTAAAILVPTIGWACEPFEASSPVSPREVHFVDRGTDAGVHAGDMRVGERAVTNLDGDRIGSYLFVQTIHAVDEEGHAADRTMQRVFVLDDGVIFTTWHFAEKPRAAADDTTASLIPAGVHAADIIGGTRAYTGASGTMELEQDDLVMTFRFDIACD
ncbi:hypothetical protein [Bauldia sp.]|uniref:hypothetical protein n=1 Tax=Bauldia sp. TaxID=2575872 RepID=UPI003BAA9134